MLVDPYAGAAGLFTNQLVVRMRFGGRHRVNPPPAPRMTAAQPAQAEPTAAPHSVPFDRLEKVTRTGRFEATAQARSAQPREHRRERRLISANEKSDDRNHQGARIEARFARRKYSSSSAAYVARAAAARAITTIQRPLRVSC